MKYTRAKLGDILNGDCHCPDCVKKKIYSVVFHMPSNRIETFLKQERYKCEHCNQEFVVKY